MNIYLIRHPKPLNVAGTCYGRQDVAVSAEESLAVASALRQRLADQVLKSAPIFTSPLSRCAVLARELASPGEPSIDQDLVEMDIGTWEGRCWDAVPRDQLDGWARDLWNYRPGGGESAQSVAERWGRFVARIRATALETAVAVTHAGVIRVALAQAGRGRRSEIAQSSVGFGSVHCLVIGKGPS